MSVGTEIGYTAWDKETEVKFPGQSDMGWGLTFDMTNKYPLISKRIFNSLDGLTGYINDPNTSAIEGLVLTVISKNEEENGAYLVTGVKRYQTNENGFIDKTKELIGEGKYIKLGANSNGGGGLSGQDVKDFIEDALNDINLDEQHVSAVTSETGYFISKVLQNKGQIHVEKTKFSDANIINKNNLNLAIAEVKDYVNTLAFSGITDENIEDIFPSNAELENIKQRVDVLEKYFTALDNEAKIITSKNIDDYAVTKLIEVGQGINISAVDPEKYYFDGKTYYWGDVNINGLDSFSNILIHDKNSEKIDDNIFTIDSN